MNAVVRAGYALPREAEMLSNQHAQRPNSVTSNIVTIDPSFLLGHRNIAVADGGNFTTYLEDASLFYGNVATSPIIDEQSIYPILSTTIYSHLELAHKIISWAPYPWSAVHISAESFWTSLRLQTLLAQFRRSGVTPYAERIAMRLEFLYRESLDDDEQPLSLDSVEHFLSFLKYVQSTTYPDITLTPFGHIYAVWGRTATRKLSLAFMDARIKYVFFYRNNIDDVSSAKGLGEVPISDIPFVIDQMPRALRAVIFTDG